MRLEAKISSFIREQEIHFSHKWLTIPFDQQRDVFERFLVDVSEVSDVIEDHQSNGGFEDHMFWGFCHLLRLGADSISKKETEDQEEHSYPAVDHHIYTPQIGRLT